MEVWAGDPVIMTLTTCNSTMRCAGFMGRADSQAFVCERAAPRLSCLRLQQLSVRATATRCSVQTRSFC